MNDLVAIDGDVDELAVTFTYSINIDPVSVNDMNVSTTDTSYINPILLALKAPIVIVIKGVFEEEVGLNVTLPGWSPSLRIIKCLSFTVVVDTLYGVVYKTYALCWKDENDNTFVRVKHGVVIAQSEELSEPFTAT
jgi:hypothetical protein